MIILFECGFEFWLVWVVILVGVFDMECGIFKIGKEVDVFFFEWVVFGDFV